MSLDVLSNLSPFLAAPLAEPALLFVFLLAVGITAISSIGFAVWLTYHVIRLCALLIVKLVMLPVPRPRRRRSQPAGVSGGSAHLACPDPVCRAVNPDHARYCRQCGRMLRAPLQAAA